MATASSIIGSTLHLFGQYDSGVKNLIAVFHRPSIFASKERLLYPDQARTIIAIVKQQFGVKCAFAAFKQLKGAFYRPYQWRRWCQKSFFPQEQIQLLEMVAQWKDLKIAIEVLKELGFYDQSKPNSRIAYQIDGEDHAFVETRLTREYLSKPLFIFQQAFGEDGRNLALKESRKHCLMKGIAETTDTEMVSLLAPEEDWKEEDVVIQHNEKPKEILLLEQPAAADVAILEALPLFQRCEDLSRLIHVFHHGDKKLSAQQALTIFQGIAASKRFTNKNLLQVFKQLKTAFIIQCWYAKTKFCIQELMDAIETFAQTTKELYLSFQVLDMTGFYDQRDEGFGREYYIFAEDQSGDYVKTSLSDELLARPICIFANVFGFYGAETAIEKSRNYDRIRNAEDTVRTYFTSGRNGDPLFDDDTIEELVSRIRHRWNAANICNAVCLPEPGEEPFSPARNPLFS